MSCLRAALLLVPQVLLVGLYLLLCVLYWAWSALQLVAELRDVLDVKHFINNKLGISDRQVGGSTALSCTWAGAGLCLLWLAPRHLLETDSVVLSCSRCKGAPEWQARACSKKKQTSIERPVLP